MHCKYPNEERQLLNMGFDAQFIPQALELHNGNIDEAINWLVNPNRSQLDLLAQVSAQVLGPGHGQTDTSASSDWANSNMAVAEDSVSAINIPSNTGYQAYANPISSQHAENVPTAVPANPSPWQSGNRSMDTSSSVAPLSYTPQSARYPTATVVGSDAGKQHPFTEDEQMQKALQMSLDCMPSTAANSGLPSTNLVPGLSREDEEMARAIEQSIATATNPVEPSNPHLRKREKGTYYSIPELRNAILQWDFTPWMSHPGGAEAASGGIALVAALQRLFAEMTLSNRKFADPSAVFKALTDLSGNAVIIGPQQDVSEFHHFFLQRVHEGLSAKKPDQIGMEAVEKSESAGAENTEEENKDGEKGVIKETFGGSMLQEVLVEGQDGGESKVEEGGEEHKVSASKVEFMELILGLAPGNLHEAALEYVEMHQIPMALGIKMHKHHLQDQMKPWNNVVPS